MTQSSVRAIPARLDVLSLRDWLDSRDLDSRNVPRVLDVRTPAEFRRVHISGSDNVPLDLLREHRGELSRHLEPTDRCLPTLHSSPSRGSAAVRPPSTSCAEHSRLLLGGSGRVSRMVEELRSP
jgi:hypothetical protein